MQMPRFDYNADLDLDEDDGASLFDRRPENVPLPPLPENSSPELPEGYPVPPPVPFAWNEEQRAAVERIVAWRFDSTMPRFMKLTGPAGTGKTLVTRELRRYFTGTRTAWTAMTGRASQRLRAAIGVKTKTYYSAVYHPPREVDNVAEAKIDLAFEDIRYASPDALLVVDESSMVSPKLKADADKSTYAKILFIGDPIQIPPVLSKAEENELGEDYSVFTSVDGPHLSRVMRNGGAVLSAANYVREQRQIPAASSEEGGSRYDYVELGSPQVVMRAAVDAWLEDREGHTLITWKNDNRNVANTVIRERLGLRGMLPEPGEPLVVRKNAHKFRLMNGDVVICEEVTNEEVTLAGISMRWFRVRREDGKSIYLLAPVGDFSGTLPYVGLETWRRALREAEVDGNAVVPLTYGYCLTCHQAQGSQYRRVTTFLPGDMRSSNFNKMSRISDGTLMKFSMRWVYTALSRAVKRTSLIVSR
ncbi:MAG: hypothetical protein EPN91_01155 [Salinibacterium sp.]|nr:MAG: hypothetical protein EPN91_01155 [Salinibacterium sp.]